MNHYFSCFLGGTAIAAVVIVQPACIAAKTPQAIADGAMPSTVQINPEKGGGGSGVIFNREGNNYSVLTCIHVINDKKRPGFDRPGLSVRANDGKIYPLTSIKRLGTIETSDLAIVTFTSSIEYPTVNLANSDQAVIGSQIFVIGYPGIGGRLNVDRGAMFVSGFVTSRQVKGSRGFEPYTLRYNAPTWGGMSGGPVFDVDGRVIGIHGLGLKEQVASGKPEKTGINAAVPINLFLALRSQQQGIANVAIDNTPSTDKPKERLSNPKSATDFVAKGAVQREQGDKSQAIDAYSKAISLDPNYADAYYQRGNARYDQGDKQGAFADYDQAIKANPELANAYYQRGVVRHNLGNKQAALADFDKYLSLLPEDAQAYNTRGRIRRELGNAQGAFEDFDTVVRLLPDEPRAYYNRGLARSMLRDKQGTLEDFNQAIALDPDWAVAYNTRAIHRRRLGDRQGAMADFSQIIRLEPDNATAFFNRGLVRRDLGDKQGAIADLQTAAKLFQLTGKTANYKTALEKIATIEAILNTPNVQPESAVDSNQPTTPDQVEPSAVDPDQPTTQDEVESEPADGIVW